MNTEELDQLIHRCLEECLSEGEAARLSTLLADSPEARARYWETASIHGLLEQTLQQASLRAITGRQSMEEIPDARRIHWRPWATAAAGLAFGIFSASVVWAYAFPMDNRTGERTIPLLTEGFEYAESPPSRGFPRRANEWSGDCPALVTAESGVAPNEGSRMAKLEHASASPRRFSYVWRIVDLAEHPAPDGMETRRLEVSAAFNTPGEASLSQYQIRLAAFREEPGEVRRIWNHEPVLFDTVLQHVGRNVVTGADERGWQTVRAGMELPPHARSVVISLAAGAADDGPPPAVQYLDTVQARIIVSPTSGEMPHP